jgi:hypothetical protein
MNTISARDSVLVTQELSDQILAYWKKRDLINQSALIFVSMKYYIEFQNEVVGQFQNLLVKYCDAKLLTNRRWAYYAYKCAGTDPKCLSYYKAEAAKDIPWKPMLSVITISMVLNLAFRRMHFTALLKPAIIISSYFLCMHGISLLVLLSINYSTNVKNFFRNMAIVMILISFLTIIINSL